jgi:hypothetical protein
LRQQAVASTSGRACLRVARSRGRHVSVRAVQDFNLWQSVDLPSIYKAQNVVPGARTLATPRLDDERVRSVICSGRRMLCPLPRAKGAIGVING